MKTKFKGILTLLLAFVVQITFAQEQTVSGTVVDENNLPLPGATVIIKGTSNGTSTDFDGKYSIKANNGDELEFSYVGYTTQTITVASNNINATMNPDNSLDEVVVTAYGTQKKETLTGSVTEIKTKEFEKVASGNAVQGLAGKVAGVQIFNNSGQPGSAPIVRFRGIGSLNGSSAPLYVVDGVPFNESITSINPQDIESMSFLKDAAAAALYGNRGANGVIIITTKKGKKGKLSVNLDVKTSTTARAVKDYDVMTGAGEYLQAYHKMLTTNDIVANGTSVAQATANASNDLFDHPTFGLVYNPFGGDRTTVIDPVTGQFRGGEELWSSDWEDALFQDGSIVSTYLSVSGGTEKSNFFLSLGHEDNEGININTGFKRYTAKISADMQALKNLKIGGSMNYTNREIKGTLTNNITGNFAWVRNIAPIYPVYAVDHTTGAFALDNNGNQQWDWADVTSPNATGPRPFNGFSNPHALQTLNVNKDIRDNLTSRFYGKLSFLKDFEFTYNFGADLNFFKSVDYTNNLVGSAAASSVNGRLTEQYGRGLTLTNQQLLNWKKTLNDKHNIDILLGHETSDYRYTSLAADLRNVLVSSDISAGLWADTDGQQPINDNPNGDINYVINYNLEGYFARALYDYEGKYLVNGSIRRDGSSVFHPDNRWGTFYGAGLGWVVSKENFMDNVSWLNQLKLKTSFGQQGNDIVFDPRGAGTSRDYTPYLDEHTFIPDGSGGYSINPLTKLGNKDLKWETNTNINAGFELAAFDNRLRVDAEYFIRRITDLIHNRELAPSASLPSVPENILDMDNKGIEVSVAYDIIRKENLNWTVSANATHYKNEITKLQDGKEEIAAGASTLYRWKVGGSAFDFYMREFLGVNPANGNAIYYSSTTPDNTTEDRAQADLKFIGKSALPKVSGGFSTEVTYKNFDLGLDFSYQFGGYAYDAIYNDGFTGRVGANFHRDYSQTWTYDNQNASLPRVFDGGTNYNTSSLFIESSDFISLNNLSLGYTLPKKPFEKIGIESVRIYGIGNNLAMWTKSKHQGFDPRQRVTGINNAVRYSTLRTLTLGLNVKF